MLRIIFFCALLAATLASKMEMPSFANVGDRVVMECTIEKKFPLQTIRWYKDNVAFFTTSTPLGDKPPEIGELPINIRDSKPGKIVIDSVVEEYSGIYTCEAQTANDVIRMCGTLSVLSDKPISIN